MSDDLRWDRDGHDWPHREHSRFVTAGGLRWHVQQMGEGPVALLIHGTGASTHSWRDLMPLLAPHATVVAMDLPGHAFTRMPLASQLSLDGMAGGIAALVEAMGLDVRYVIGHSAGAAIGARMALDGRIAPDHLAGINAALLPLRGLAGLVFPAAARLMSVSSLAPRLFARVRWDAASVERLIAGTGSRLDRRGLMLYARLLRDERHTAAALAMMARWNLPALASDLPKLRTPVTLVVGSNDRAVPPADATRVRRLLPTDTPCAISTLGGGHLVHEEQPAAVAALLLRSMRWPADRPVSPATAAETACT